MFSREENEKLRREKLRGGDFKEGSSESSNDNSDHGSPDQCLCRSMHIGNLCPIIQKKRSNPQESQTNKERKKNKRNHRN